MAAGFFVGFRPTHNIVFGKQVILKIRIVQIAAGLADQVINRTRLHPPDLDFKPWQSTRH